MEHPRLLIVAQRDLDTNSQLEAVQLGFLLL